MASEGQFVVSPDSGKELITFGLCVFTVGIAFGSYLAARASRARPNLALVPVGALLRLPDVSSG